MQKFFILSPYVRKRDFAKSSMKVDVAVGVLNPVSDKNEGRYRGRNRGNSCDHG